MVDVEKRGLNTQTNNVEFRDVEKTYTFRPDFNVILNMEMFHPLVCAESLQRNVYG